MTRNTAINLTALAEKTVNIPECICVTEIGVKVILNVTMGAPVPCTGVCACVMSCTQHDARAEIPSTLKRQVIRWAGDGCHSDRIILGGFGRGGL